MFSKLGLQPFIAIVLCFLALELLTRACLNHYLVYDVEMTKYAMGLKQDDPDPFIDHVHKPNASARLMGVMIHTNADGFRGRDCLVARTNQKRIMFLGDSFTLGWGVKEEETFHDILEKELSRIYPTEIINTGTGNYTTEQQVHHFIKKGLQYHPDKVVMFFVINSVQLTQHKSSWWFLGYSQLLTLYWSRLHAWSLRLDPAKNYKTYYADLYQEGRPGLARAKEAFLLLRDICAKNGILLQVVFIPEFHDLAHYPFKQEQRMMADFLKNNGIDVLDITSMFSPWERPGDLWVASDDPHPNGKAHQLIAEFTFDFIKKGLYPSPLKP